MKSAKELMAELLQDRDCANALKNNNFQRVFSYAKMKYGTEGTQALVVALESCDINFLEHMKVVPAKCFYKNTYLATVELPNSIEQINALAFGESEYLEEVHFNEGLRVIAQMAFKRCKQLKKAILPSTINVVMAQAFAFDSELEEVDLKNVSVIGQEAFVKCPKLERVFIPKSVKDLGMRAFDNDIQITYEGSEEEFNKLTHSNDLVKTTYNHVKYLNK